MGLTRRRACAVKRGQRLVRESRTTAMARYKVARGALYCTIRHDVARLFLLHYSLTYLCRRQAAEPLPTQCSGPSQAPRRLVVVR